MNALIATQIQNLLREISQSIRRPGTVTPGPPDPAAPERFPLPPESEARSGSVLPLVSMHKRLPRRPALSAIRMQCLRLLKNGEALTPCETAARLGLDPDLIQLQLCELQRLRLIEKSGTRRLGSRAHDLFQLNKTHPLLKLLLGSIPGREQTAAPE